MTNSPSDENRAQASRLTLEDAMARVPWQELATAQGNATHVPEALFGLMSDDERVRVRSYEKLRYHIVLGGNLYEAAYHAVPLLLQMLQSVDAAAKPLIYNLLIEIMHGFAPDESLCTTIDGAIDEGRQILHGAPTPGSGPPHGRRSSCRTTCERAAVASVRILY